MDPTYDYGSYVTHLKFSHPTYVIRSRTLIRSSQMIISPCGVIESSKEYEFSYKFDNAQWEEIL